jgi:hypothetical protein
MQFLQNALANVVVVSNTPGKHLGLTSVDDFFEIVDQNEFGTQLRNGSCHVIPPCEKTGDYSLQSKMCIGEMGALIFLPRELIRRDKTQKDPGAFECDHCRLY